MSVAKFILVPAAAALVIMTADAATAIAHPSNVTMAAQGKAESAGVKRKSFKCASPKGEKLNISWDPGNVSVTVYFNNHCKQKRNLKLDFKQATDVCFTVNPKTKGKKKVYTTGAVLRSITSPSEC
ncbi:MULTISPECIES: hypothetical protein [unclassified Nonomuraea]|uniref:hypothetical protein n=1 Tax=unclassified Nonomuraea TaxID=2593643 RepID=UPI0034075F3F